MNILPYLLTSNEEPSPEEAAAVHKALRELESDARRLVATAPDDSQPKNGLASGETLQSQIALHKAILSPHRRLPSEVLGEIFFYFAPDLVVETADVLRRNLNHHGPDSGLSVPWFLGQICRRWRAVALSIGELWSTLHIRHGNVSLSQTDIAQATADSMRECLRRSGQARLSFLLDMRRVWQEWVNIAVLERLLEHSHRWKTVHLCAVSPGALTVLTKKDPRDFPALRNVRLSLLALEDGASRLGFPWSQLTRYHEDQCRWTNDQDQWHTLSQLTDVEYLRTEVMQPHEFAVPVRLPRLRCASFMIFPAQEFLASIELPVVEALNLHALNGGALHAVPPHFRGTLRILRLSSGIQVFKSEFLELLAALPALVELWLEVPGAFSREVVARLTLFEHAMPLLPNLQVLRIDDGAFAPHVAEKLIAMLRSRFAPPAAVACARLRAFEAKTRRVSGRFAHKEIAKSLRDLKEQEGWDVEVRQSREKMSSVWDEWLPGELEGGT